MIIPPDLAAAIHAAPDDPAGYRVLGDWLEQLGRPEAELIALMFAGRDDARVGELQYQLDPLRVGLEWRWGFARRAVAPRGGSPQPLAAVIRSPVGGFLRELSVPALFGGMWIETLVELAPAELRSLAALHLGGEADPPLVLDPLWRALPRLERVAIDVACVLQPFEAPSLRELRIELADARQVAALLATRLPALERLHAVDTGALLGATAAISPSRFPALRALTITTPHVAHHAAQLAHAPIAAQLEVADVVQRVGYPYLQLADRVFPIDRRARTGEAALLVTAGNRPRAGSLIRVPAEGRHFLGSNPRSLVALRGAHAGNHHAYVERRGARWILRDAAHSATTVLNGRMVHECELRCGDEIAITRHELMFLEGDVDALAAEHRRRRGLG